MLLRSCGPRRAGARLGSFLRSVPGVPAARQEEDNNNNDTKIATTRSAALSPVGGAAAAFGGWAALSGVALAEPSSLLAGIPEATGLLATTLKVAPPACFFLMQLSGLKTVQQIAKTGSTGDLRFGDVAVDGVPDLIPETHSVLPFLSLATNCAVWSLYGSLLGDLTVLAPNLSGLAFGLYYTSVFAKHSKVSVLPQVGVAGAIAAGCAGLAASLPVAEAAPYIGYTGCTLAVILMSSPLATIGTVLKTKSTAAMPFATSLATFFNASAWTSYGALVAHDMLIVGPNALGVAASVVQLSLIARFGIAPPAAAAAAAAPRAK